MVRQRAGQLISRAALANATEGRFVYDLGDGQWNIPSLRILLEECCPQRRYEKLISELEKAQD